MRVEAGWDVVSDVLENHFLKAFQQDGCESHGVVVMKTRHSRLFGTGTMTPVSRQKGTVPCESEC